MQGEGTAHAKALGSRGLLWCSGKGRPVRLQRGDGHRKFRQFLPLCPQKADTSADLHQRKVSRGRRGKRKSVAEDWKGLAVTEASHVLTVGLVGGFRPLSDTQTCSLNGCHLSYTDYPSIKNAQKSAVPEDHRAEAGMQAALGLGPQHSVSSQSRLCGDVLKEQRTQPCSDKCPRMLQVQARRQSITHLHLHGAWREGPGCGCAGPQGRAYLSGALSSEQVWSRGCWGDGLANLEPRPIWRSERGPSSGSSPEDIDYRGRGQLWPSPGRVCLSAPREPPSPDGNQEADTSLPSPAGRQ